MEETWEDIIGYEGIYQISSFGRIYSFFKKNILKHNKTKYGYLLVCLYKNGIPKKCSIHRLVANAFLPKPVAKRDVNHLDSNKANNNVLNLEWCTKKENMNHAKANNLVWKHERCLKSKLNNLQVRVIRHLAVINPLMTQEKLASLFNISRSNIGNILTERIWKNLPRTNFNI